MKLLSVVCARFDKSNNVMHVVKEVESPDGTTHLNLQVFSPETLAARSAEYGTEDLDELVDIVIHEPHIEPVEHLNMSAEQALSLHRAGRAAVKAATPGRSMSPKDDKADKETKLRRAGVGQEYIDALEEDALEVIKRYCELDSEHVKHFKKHVDTVRKQRTKLLKAEGSSVTKTEAKYETLRQQEQIMKTKVPRLPTKPQHVRIVLNKNKVT